MERSTPTAPLTVVYANDPLCGWCFATGPAVAAARTRTAGLVPWRVESGGLVVGDRVRPVADDREYLVRGLAEVARVSGRRAGRAYHERVLGPGTWVSDSEPAVRAVLVARQLHGDDLAITLAHGLTDALYLHGRTPDDPATVADVAGGLGADGDELADRWTTPDAVALSRIEMARARQLGITTYPSLFLDHGGRIEPLLAGFADADRIVAAVHAAVDRAGAGRAGAARAARLGG